jgi:mannose-6-phosphate isomerase
MVVALEPFDALCGWREPARTRAVLEPLAVDQPGWAHLLGLLSGPDARDALRETVSWLLGDDDRIPALVGAVGRAATEVAADRPEYATVAALSRAHPGDPGLVVALLLNRVRLAPGEALYLPAGNVHAYLEGTAVEVMASSDNVLRAGLTTKHVDTAELMRITDFTPRPLPVVLPQHAGPVTIYRPGAAEFELVFLTVTGDDGWQDVPVTGPRILLVLQGDLDVSDSAGPAEPVRRGDSLFVPAASGALTVRGNGTAVVAGVPAARSGR